jgi:hypothetical protein
VILDYSRFDVSVPERVVQPLLPMPVDGMRALAWACMLAAAVAVSLASWRLIARGRIIPALWLFVAGMLLVQPFTLYHYLIVLLPGLLWLALSPDSRLSLAAVAAYILLGIARFVGLLTALSPAALFLIAAHLGTLAIVVLEIGIYLAARKARAP